MPFESGALELAFLAMVALIVVGPKDLPVLLRKVGQFTAKMRGLAAEFRASFDEMARQSELDELRREVEALRTGQFAAHAVPELESHVGEINVAMRTPSLPAPAAAEPLSLDPVAPEPAVSDPVRAREPQATRDAWADAEPLLPFDPPIEARATAPRRAPAMADEPVMHGPGA